MIHPLIVEAHRLVTTTNAPIKEIAALVGMKAPALEQRLFKAYGKRARGLRTGAPPTLGRPPSLREEWRVRLTAAERLRVEAALVVGYATGARSDGEALAAALLRVEEADPARAQASAEATLGRELAALHEKFGKDHAQWGEERAAWDRKVAKQQATIERLKAEARENTKPGAKPAKPPLKPTGAAPVATKPRTAPAARPKYREMTAFEALRYRCNAGKGSAEDMATLVAWVEGDGVPPPAPPPVATVRPAAPPAPIVPPTMVRPGFAEEVRATAERATPADYATIAALGGFNGCTEWRREVDAAAARLRAGDIVTG